MKLLIFLIAFVINNNSTNAQNFHWAKSIEINNNIGSNLLSDDIFIDHSNGVYNCGYFSSDIDFDPSPATYIINAPLNTNTPYIAKYNGLGHIQWAKKFDVSYVGYINSMAFDINNNIYVTINYSDSIDTDPSPTNTLIYTSIDTSDHNFVVIKLDSNGVFLWSKNFEGTINNTYAMDVDKIGNCVFNGSFTGIADVDPNTSTSYLLADTCSRQFIVKLSSNGNLLWTKTMRSNSFTSGVISINSISIDNSNNIIYGGKYTGTVDFNPSNVVNNMTSASAFTMFLSKIDVNGNYIWSGEFVNSSIFSSNNIFKQIEVDKQNNIIVVGAMVNGIDFDPSTAVQNRFSNGMQDGFIAKYDSNFNYKWAHNFGSPNGDYINCIAIDTNNNCYIRGMFSGTVDFDPGTNTFYKTPPAFQSSTYFLKLDSNSFFNNIITISVSTSWGILR